MLCGGGGLTCGRGANYRVGEGISVDEFVHILDP